MSRSTTCVLPVGSVWSGLPLVLPSLRSRLCDCFFVRQSLQALAGGDDFGTVFLKKHTKVERIFEERGGWVSQCEYCEGESLGEYAGGSTARVDFPVRAL